MNSIEEIVQKLKLLPHPEGGFFKETYRSEGTILKSSLAEVFKSKRNYCTGIYYLLKSNDFSAFHKINQDEMWHFYIGSPIELHMISENGVLSTVKIGNDILNDEVLQFVVPKNYWFAAKVVNSDSYSLVGCTVAPGFDFKDFTLASRKDLSEKFPQHSAIIKAFTRQ
ncbi:MAG: cupin domain-containing protein [Winogradskyella sp.]|nr:MAG: cupin domain-containing protein [Winogradskyella sp.]